MQYLEFPLREDGSATLCAYLLDPQIRFDRRKTRPAMLVCPGGAYLTLATKEAEPVAARMLGLGYQSFVVRYKHYVLARPEQTGGAPKLDEDSHLPEQIVDLMSALRIVHEHAAEWGIDEQRIYCLGFSAGAHLVGSLAERWDEPELLARAGATSEQTKPAGVVLCYPMISAGPLLRDPSEVPPEMAPMLALVARAIFGTDAPTPEQMEAVDLVRHVRPDMPRVFAWHSSEDVVVDPAETLAFFSALQAAHVPCELHFFERGSHGTSLCDTTSADSENDVIPANAAWVEACRRWLELDAPEELYSYVVE